MNKSHTNACQDRKNHQFEAFNFVDKAFKTYMIHAFSTQFPAYGDTTG